MGTVKPFVIILTLLISSLAGCLDSTESDEPVERTEHIHVECFGVVETNPECDIDFSVGRGIEPMISSKILSELESNDYDEEPGPAPEKKELKSGTGYGEQFIISDADREEYVEFLAWKKQQGLKITAKKIPNKKGEQ